MSTSLKFSALRSTFVMAFAFEVVSLTGSAVVELDAAEVEVELKREVMLRLMRGTIRREEDATQRDRKDIVVGV